MRRALAFLFVALWGAVVAPEAAAQEALLERPRPDAGPTKVRVGIYLLDIEKISGVDRALTLDFMVRAEWRDPRLAGATRTVDLVKAWTPRLVIVNERRVFKKLDDVLLVDEEGNVVYLQRYYGQLSAPVRLHDFPLDEHTLGIRLVTAGLSPEEVELVADERYTGQAEGLSVADWAVGPGAVRIEPHTLEAIGIRLAGIAYEFQVERYLGFFVWKIILPLVIIVIMSWTVFWLDPVETGPQIGLSVTSMLTVIAYRFVLVGFLPHLPYLTRLDLFVFWATGLVFLALGQEVWTSRLAAKEQGDRARRIDRWSRAAFPVAFVFAFYSSFYL